MCGLCLHSAYSLQETIATSREVTDNCFVAFFDVAKAFDTIWINGLFYQLFKLGISGKIWRMMRLTYTNFECRVKIASKVSKPYFMECGIHQGGILSLLKYVAYTNSLLVQLVNSNLCLTIKGIKSTPIGYADDLSTACITRDRLDRVLLLVQGHSTKWRYQYNADKSAILTFGESKKDHMVNKNYRTFKLGGKKIPEKVVYEHVGTKAYIHDDDNTFIDDKLSKGRKTLNMCTGIGIKHKGINMACRNMIFWLIVVPTTLFGSELWTINDAVMQKLENFQKYSGRRIQRFGQNSPSAISYFGLGWMNLCTYVLFKKLMFAYTIINMEVDTQVRMMFTFRSIDFNNNLKTGMANRLRSPTFEILKASVKLGLYDTIMNMVHNNHHYTKREWKDVVLKKAWQMEDKFWLQQKRIFNIDNFLIKTLEKPRYLTWWLMSDLWPQKMGNFDDMARLVCGVSRLKADDPIYKKLPFGSRACILCQNCAEENIQHLIMQCSFHETMRKEMFDEIRKHTNVEGEQVIQNNPELLLNLLGKKHENIDMCTMTTIWMISSKYISQIYRNTLKIRVGWQGSSDG